VGNVAAAGVNAAVQVDGNVTAAGLAFKGPAPLSADQPALDKALHLLAQVLLKNRDPSAGHVLEHLASSLQELLVRKEHVVDAPALGLLEVDGIPLDANTGVPVHDLGHAVPVAGTHHRHQTAEIIGLLKQLNGPENRMATPAHAVVDLGRSV